MTRIRPDPVARRQAAERAEAEGDLTRAEEMLRRSLATAPGDRNAAIALADFLVRRGRFAEAERHYRKLLAAFPNAPVLLNSMAVLLHKTGRREEAIGMWQRVHAAHPSVAAPLVNIGLARRDAGDASAAVAAFELALAVEPGALEAHYNLGITYYHSRRYEAALASFEAVLRLKPDDARAAVMLAQASQALCDWDRLDRLMPVLRLEAAKACDGKSCAVTPWFSLRLPFDRATRKAIAAAAARAYEQTAAPIAAELGFAFAPTAKEKLTIGYISGDFRDHPGFQLTRGMYRRHDRSRFCVIAYAVKVPTAEAAEILENDCNAVVDLSGMTDIEAAKRIHADGVDILVDISGISEFMRLGILALRPASVQVSWLSYAGTISGRLYDYLIGDPVVTSPEHQGDYLEMVARLPDSYQINDCDQVIGEAPERAEEGLPERAFVFACFCGGEKIERDVFGRWMEILRECPGAVLWLFGEVPALKANLRRAASSHGVEPIRLVFARRLPKVRHLGRVTLADLHLDTGTYGSHTTASDALWAGVPLVSVEGDAFPSRVGASLLRAVGLPELVVQDWGAYVRLAVALARDPVRLSGLRERLSANRLTTPLFDTGRSVRGLEALYQRMWAAKAGGAPPAPIDL